MKKIFDIICVNKITMNPQAYAEDEKEALELLVKANEVEEEATWGDLGDSVTVEFYGCKFVGNQLTRRITIMWISKHKYNNLINQIDKVIKSLDIVKEQQQQIIKDTVELNHDNDINSETDIINKLQAYLDEEYKSLQDEYIHTPDYEDRIEIVGARESIRSVKEFLESNFEGGTK